MAASSKKLLIAVVAVLAVGSGAAWYIVSGKAVSGAVRVIDALNSQPHADGSTIKLTYERLERTGFPAIGVRLVNPAMEVVMPPSPLMPMEGNTPAPSPEPVVIHWKRTGTVDVVTDYIAHEYRLVSKGSGHIDMKAGDQSVNAESNNADIRMQLKANSFAAFNAWGKLNLNDANAVREALKNIAAAGFDMGPMVLKDATTGNPIFSQESARLKLVNRSTPETYDIDLDASMKDSEVSQAYNDVMMHVLNVLQPAIHIDFDGMPFSAARAGKQDFDLSLHANMPTNTVGPMSNGDVTISRLAIKNNFYTVELPTSIKLSEVAGKRRAFVKLDWMVDVTAAGAAEMQHVFDTTLGFAPAIARAQAAGQPAPDMNVLKEKLLAALPNVSTLGPVKLAVDFDLAVPAPDANGDEAQTLTIRTIAFSHKRWGIEASGNGEKVMKKGTTMHFKIVCKQCDAFINDTLQTAMQAQTLFNAMDPEHPRVFVNDATLPKVNAMLADLGRKDDAGNVLFVIETPAPNDVRLNDKPYAQAMVQMMMAFDPGVPPTPAPATPLAPVETPKPAPATVSKDPAKPAPAKHSPR